MQLDSNEHPKISVSYFGLKKSLSTLVVVTIPLLHGYAVTDNSIRLP